MSQKSYRRIFASHSSISSLRLQKGSLGLYVIIIIIITITGTYVCDQNHSLTTNSRVVAMVQWENRALIPKDSRFQSGWTTLDFSPKVNFHNVSSVPAKIQCRYSSLVPRPASKFSSKDRGVASPGWSDFNCSIHQYRAGQLFRHGVTVSLWLNVEHYEKDK